VTLSRREFVGAAAAAGVTALQPQGILPGSADRLKKIGVQLYTIRQALEANFEGTLERLAAIGYREVEFAWNRGVSPANTRAALRSAGLSAPSTHREHRDFEAGWTATAKSAETLGTEYLVLAGIDNAARLSLDDYRQWADRFNQFGRKVRGSGFRFAYHNHATELVPIGGQHPYDLLLQGTDPTGVRFEMDIYWVLEGGGDPRAYFAKRPGRFLLLNLKGRAADGRMVDVGAGAVDWAALFSERKQAGVQHLFVEHDEPADAFASVTASYEYLRALRFRDA
jgi:sugar phosphate isomerase/epimerase